MSESVYLIREQGSGEPRASRSALIELATNEKMTNDRGQVQTIIAPSANTSCIASDGNFQSSTFRGLLFSSH